MSTSIAVGSVSRPSRPPTDSDLDLFAAVFEASDAGLYVAREDGTLLCANAAFGRLLGRSIEDLVGRPVAELLPPEEWPAAVQANQVVFAEGGEVRRDWYLFRADGARIEVREHARVHVRPDGSRVRIATVLDVTEKKKLEERSRLFSTLLSSAPVAFFALDAGGRYTAAEGKGFELAGDRPSDLLGLDGLERQRGTEAESLLRRALAGESVEASVTMKGQNGPLDYRAWYTPLRTPKGDADGVIGFALDVTGDRIVERHLKEKLELMERQRSSIELFQRVLDSAPFVLSSIDAAGTFTLCEGKGLEILGMTPAELVGVNAFELYNNAEMADALTRTLAGEEIRLISSPVPDTFFDAWYLPVQDRTTGETVGANILSLDVTERMRAENDLREKLELIERQSATIRALATPIIKVWDEVLCLPVIGTVDSARTAEMMDALLQAIVKDQARFAVVDLTGVEVVDTSTADHVIQLFKAASVLGVEGILCGIRPAVAQTVVALGVDLTAIRTMRTLQEALRFCIRARSASATRSGSRAVGRKTKAAVKT